MENKKINETTRQEEILARIRLNAALPYSADKANAIIHFYGSARESIKKSADELVGDGLLTIDMADRFSVSVRQFNAENEFSSAEKKGIRILIPDDPEYPERLSCIYDPPVLLYVRGDCSKFDTPAAAIVGTRHPTSYGLRMTDNISYGLAERGVAVASGLARGIDSAAHAAALRAGGITWAVLGTGLLETYPRENGRLADEIADSGGAVISEYPLRHTARQISFPRRNRIISGISNAVAVIEGTFKSGSLITARCALEQGREVLALPGRADSVYSQGPNNLIRNGAALAESADDIIGCFSSKFRRQVYSAEREEKRRNAAIMSLSPEAAAIYETIRNSENGLTIDEVCLHVGYTAQQASAAIFELEVSGLTMQRLARYVAL